MIRVASGDRTKAIGTVLAIACLLIGACDRTAPEKQAKPVASRPDLAEPVGFEAQETDTTPDPFWDGLDRNSIQLDQTLLVVKGSKGVAGCTYLNIDTFEGAGEVCIILPAADFDGMLDAKVRAATSGAKALGIEVGMPGREALELLR